MIGSQFTGLKSLHNPLPKFPYYMVALVSVGGHTAWIKEGELTAITTVYSRRAKFDQLKQARVAAQGLVDKHPTCDIFIVMVETLGRAVLCEYVHKYRRTTITPEPLPPLPTIITLDDPT